MDTTDLAMVSRIRVEVRGGSMEAAERVAFLLLGQVQMVGWLEGVTPQSGEYTDHHFHRPNMTMKFTDPPEPWSELGLPYAGRLVFTFEPSVMSGGIPQSGFEVTQIEDYRPHGLHGHEGSDKELLRSDVSKHVIVLDRKNKVVDQDEPVTPPTLGQERIDQFELFVTRDYEQVQIDGLTPLRVTVSEWGPSQEGHPTLVSTRYSASTCVRDAEAPLEVERLMASARMYVNGIVSERRPKSAHSMPVSELTTPTVADALCAYPYRTLIVGASDAMSMATEVRDTLIDAAVTLEVRQLARELSVRWDEDHDPDRFTLTTKVVEP